MDSYQFSFFENKRFFRFILAALLVAFGISIIFPSGFQIASAESGSIDIDHTIDYNYTMTDTGATVGSPTWTKIKIYGSTFRQIYTLTASKAVYDATFVMDSESTPFTITSGGSGSGIAYYLKNDGTGNWQIRWSFDNTIITPGSDLILSYTTNIFSNVSFGRWAGSGAGSDVSASKPACISYTWSFETCPVMRFVPQFLEGFTHYYDVSYSGNLFTYSADRPGGFSTKYTFYSDTQTYGIYDYSTNQYFNFTDVYLDGLFVNVTTATGYSVYELINATNSSVVIVTPPIVDPITGVGIKFDADNYVLGAVANISWIRTNPTPFLFTDFIALDDPSGTTAYLVTSPPDNGYVKTSLNIAGTYTVRFTRCLITCATQNSDTATVVNEMASYILINSSVPVGQYTSGTYLRGWNDTGGSIDIFKDVGGIFEKIDSLALQACCAERTVSQLFFPSPGNYRVVLMKGYNETKAIALTTAYYQEIVPKLNITTSNISLNKVYYTFGESYIISHQTDSINFSNKVRWIDVYQISTGSSAKLTDLSGQMGTYSGAFSSDKTPFSGSLNVRLMGKNDTGSYVLAYTNFTLSNIDTEGYGLSIAKSKVCTGEQTAFTYYAPSTAYLSIIDKSYTWKEYNLNASTTGKTISFTVSLPGKYELMLRNVKDGYVKFSQIVEVESCEAVTEATEESPFTALWGSNVFWAVVVLFLFAGVGFYYAGVGGGVIGGGLGIISGALLGWIPLWAIFLFAAVAFIGAAIVVTSGMRK